MASFELLCDYALWNVDYVVDTVLGEIMKMCLQSNADEYVHEKTKVKTVAHQLSCLEIACIQNCMFLVKM